MSEKRAIIVVGHGSRSKDSIVEFDATVKSFRDRVEGARVEGAYMEIASPNIPTVLKKLVDEGCNSFLLIPYFLFTGIHIKEDIPEIIEELKAQYPDIKLELGKPIGAHPMIVDILVDRMENL